MSDTFSDMIAGLPPHRQKKIQAEYEALRAQELTLQQLRKAQKLTQDHMAKTLRKPQGTISKIEQRSNMMLTTLRGYVEAMGGELNFVVRFPEGDSVSLIGLADDADRLSAGKDKHV
jgi:DNA-binding XRE family transcriptional regulator